MNAFEEYSESVSVSEQSSSELSVFSIFLGLSPCIRVCLLENTLFPFICANSILSTCSFFSQVSSLTSAASLCPSAGQELSTKELLLAAIGGNLSAATRRDLSPPACLRTNERASRKKVSISDLCASTCLAACFTCASSLLFSLRLLCSSSSCRQSPFLASSRSRSASRVSSSLARSLLPSWRANERSLLSRSVACCRCCSVTRAFSFSRAYTERTLLLTQAVVVLLAILSKYGYILLRKRTWSSSLSMRSFADSSSSLLSFFFSRSPSCMCRLRASLSRTFSLNMDTVVLSRLSLASSCALSASSDILRVVSWCILSFSSKHFCSVLRMDSLQAVSSCCCALLLLSSSSCICPRSFLNSLTCLSSACMLPISLSLAEMASLSRRMLSLCWDSSSSFSRRKSRFTRFCSSCRSLIYACDKVNINMSIIMYKPKYNYI